MLRLQTENLCLTLNWAVFNMVVYAAVSSCNFGFGYWSRDDVLFLFNCCDKVPNKKLYHRNKHISARHIKATPSLNKQNHHHLTSNTNSHSGQHKMNHAHITPPYYTELTIISYYKRLAVYSIRIKTQSYMPFRINKEGSRFQGNPPTIPSYWCSSKSVFHMASALNIAKESLVLNFPDCINKLVIHYTM